MLEHRPIGVDASREYCLEVRKASAMRSFHRGEMSEVEYRDAVSAIDQLGITRSLRSGAPELRAAKATYADVDTCGECGATSQYGQYCTECGEPMRVPKQAGKFCTSCGAEFSGDRADHVCSETRGDYERRLTVLNFLEDVNGNV